AAAWWKQHRGLYHLSTTGHTSWCGFTEEILRQAFAQGLLAAPLPVVHGIPATDYPTPAVRPMNSCLNTHLFAEHFGLALPDWKTALSTCLSEA
ncbi:MAG: sugar nucleotide-binding protein, partial [Burkholderiales bacterium]|nr:sugar nucleotide-binding protein [Burkholderiales bacterium]